MHHPLDADALRRRPPAVAIAAPVGRDDSRGLAPHVVRLVTCPRQAELGCRVDGGGESPRHSDAEIIAAVVARLPVAHGGKGMAVRVAQLARACDEPDYMGGEMPRVVPVTWKSNQHGWHAGTERVGVERVLHRGRIREVEVRACPITWSPSAARIASARREYLAWWGALMHIAMELRTIDLAGWRVTASMPDLEPWRKSS